MFYGSSVSLNGNRVNLIVNHNGKQAVYGRLSFVYESDPPVTHRSNSYHRYHSNVLCPLLQTRHVFEYTVKIKIHFRQVSAERRHFEFISADSGRLWKPRKTEILNIWHRFRSDSLFIVQSDHFWPNAFYNTSFRTKICVRFYKTAKNHSRGNAFLNTQKEGRG